MQTCLSGSVDGLRRRGEASQKQMQGTDDRELVTDSRQHLPSHSTSVPIGDFQAAAVRSGQAAAAPVLL